jgi:hypothetical protein
MLTEIHLAYMWVLAGVGLTLLDIYESLAACAPEVELRRAYTAAALTLLICVAFAPVVAFYRVWKIVK